MSFYIQINECNKLAEEYLEIKTLIKELSISIAQSNK